MIHFFLLLALAMLGCQQTTPSSPVEISRDNQDSIVGGVDVPPMSRLNQQVLSFKIAVTIEKQDAPPRTAVSQCTASAISPSILLTAAHCISLSPNTVHTLYLKNNLGESVALRSNSIVVHPEYLKGNKSYDLALVLLEKTLPADIEILNLPEKEPSLNLTQVQAAGFGRSDGRPAYKGNLGILRSVELDVVSYVHTSPTFIVSQNQGKGFCQGDSGGPAIITIDGKPYVVGVASRTFFNPEVPLEERNLCIDRGQYITVQFHVDWIREEAQKLMTKTEGSST